jgi:hypothetical protein
MSSPSKRAPWLWPLLLMIAGVVLLLDNFLLIDFDITRYWPLVLVALGLQLLLRGDIAPSWQAHTFGITRGSVKSASIEIESGELDVQLRALRAPGRLIAGQYSARSRPGLVVRNNHATLRMQRGQSWWLSLADWDVGLAHDLPWGLLLSSYLGRLDVDLRGLVIERAYFASGFGNVTVTCSDRPSGPIFARSTFGDVRLTVPDNCQATITVPPSPLARVRWDEKRFRQIEPGVYASISSQDEVDSDMLFDLRITVSTVFGAIYIA